MLLHHLFENMSIILKGNTHNLNSAIINCNTAHLLIICIMCWLLIHFLSFKSTFYIFPAFYISSASLLSALFMNPHAVLFRANRIFFYVSSLIPRISSLLLTGRVKKERSIAAEVMAQFVCSHDTDELLFHCGKIIFLNHDSWHENNRMMQHQTLLFFCSNACRGSIY